jgi:orotidine-5'-phosphate decarboxylase
MSSKPAPNKNAHSAEQLSGQRILCLGIDPLPASGLQKDWLECFENHMELFERLEQKPLWVKLNLAFFIRWGRLGIDKLELACETLAGRTSLLLDGKFGEIGNSLNQYLDFAFAHLKADGVTVNPFMGEHVIGSSLQKALSLRGPSARVFVLSATSEFPKNKLAALQHTHAAIAEACDDAHRALDVSGALASHVGLVVGANRDDALSNETLIRLQLPLLMPGVGAQGITLSSAVERTHHLRQDIIFPVSRAICEGGNLRPADMQSRFEALQTELDALIQSQHSSRSSSIHSHPRSHP